MIGAVPGPVGGSRLGRHLRFRPRIEADVPAGFPAPAPVGEIVLKQYPAYRLARAEIHAIGLAEVERIRREIADLGERVGVHLVLARQVRRLDLELAVGDVRERTARALVQLSRRYGEPLDHGLLIGLRLSREEIAEVRKVLAEEDEASAELVNLRVFAGLSVVEAGKMLGMETTTAYKTWNFARSWLATCLDESGV